MNARQSWICCVGYAILCSRFLPKFVQRKGPMHEPMRLASTTETLIKYVRTRCLTAHRGHNIYCKSSPLDCMACPVFVSRASGLARETIPVYFPTSSIWSPNSPRRVWGLDYSIVYSYLGICHVFVMRSSRSLMIILPGHTAHRFGSIIYAQLQTLHAFQAPAPFPFPYPFFDSNFGALAESARHERGYRLSGVSRHSCAMAEKETAGQYKTYLQYQYHEVIVCGSQHGKLPPV